MATCGFTRPRSFTEDNAFSPRAWRQATVEAKEWGEVSVAD